MRKIIILLLVCLIFTPFHYLKIEQAKADEPDNFTFKWRINYGDYSSWSPPVVEDINGDGIYEIFLTAKYLPGGKAGIFCINGSNGNIIWQTNFTSLKDWHIPMAVGDLNNDGTYELVHAAGSKTIARNCEDGSIFWDVNTDSGWGSPAIADTDGTGIPYVFVGDNSGFDAPVTISKLYGNNGTLAAQSDRISYTCYGGVSIADLDRDGDYEIVMSDSGNSHCFDENLNELWTTTSYTSESHCAILTNVTGDADLEVIILEQDMSAPYNGGIHVYYADGTEVPGMNDGTLGLGCHCQPAVHDIDQDGNVEVLTSYGGTDCTVWDLINWEADALLEKGCEPPDIANVLGDSALEVVSPSAYVDGQVDIYDSSYDNVDTIGGYGNPIYGMNTVVQDIDNDGLNEIIISGPGEGNMTVYDTLVTAPTPRVRTDIEYYSERRCNAGEYIPKIGPKCTLSNPSIPDYTSEVSLSTSTIEITINEPDNDPIDWSIETSPNIGKASGTSETNGVKTCNISNLQPDTTYRWYINASDKTNWKCETYTFTTTSEGTSYYISNDGDDSNSGTSPDEAWETITKVNTELANDNIEIGDDIYFKRGDTFYGEIDLRNGGTPDNYMIIGSYGTGAKPVIDNSVGMEDKCCIKIWYDISGYYQIENLKVCNTTGSGDGIHVHPTLNENNHTDIIIRNVEAENINGREGIFLEGVINYTIENIKTKGCTLTLYGDEYNRLSNGKVFNCTLNGEFKTYGLSIHRADSKVENYDAGDFHWFKNITVYNNEDEENAIDITAGKNLLFEDCEVYNGDHVAFGIGHEVTNLTIQNCYVHDHNGDAFNIGTSNSLIIRNNIAYNVSGTLLKFETEDGTLWNREDGYNDNVTIYHNTFIQPEGWTGTNRLSASDYDYFTDTEIKNNIIASVDQSNPSALYRTFAAIFPPTDEVTFNSNIWYHGSGSSNNQWWNGDSWLDLSEWQNYYPTEVFENPELKDIGSYDFTLSSSSPCIDSGSFLTQTDGSDTGTTFTVDDSSYFMDGYGFITGDSITVGDNSGLIVIDVDYSRNQITVDQSFTWNNNEDVSLDYNGTSPDIGAYESEHILGPEDGYYYVSTTGDDDNDGSYENPWETIQKAVNTLTAGETVYILEGVYNGYNTPWSGASSGTSDAWITYTNYQDDEVILDGTGGTDQCDGLFWFDNQGYIRISELTFRNSSCNGVRFSCAGGPNTHNITIDNCTFYNCSDAGIYLYPYSGNNGFIEDVLIENNTLYNCQNGWNHQPCAPNEVITIGNVTRFVVRNNYLYQNHKIGIDAKDEVRDGEIYNNRVNTTPTGLWNLGGSGIYIDAFDDNARDIKVYKNIIWGNGTGYAIATEQGGTLTDIDIYNNIYNGTGNGFQINNHTGVPGNHLKKDCSFINNHIAVDTSICIQLTDRHSSFENFTIRNNILNGNIGINIATHSDLDLSAHNVDHNLFNIIAYSHYWGSNAINGSPMFVDPENGDYTLTQGSPAIDNGSSLYAPIKDFNGEQRPQGEAIDIGAYESSYSFDPDNTAPVVSNIPDQTINEGESFTTIILDNYVSDSEDSDSEISWSYSGNTDLDVSIVDRVATVSIPDEGWNGQETITFTATDTGMLSDSDFVVFTVKPVNDIPVVSSPSPSNSHDSVSKGLSSISVSISDPEGDSFNWSISTNPDIGSASNTFDSNGSKSVSLSGLSYSTTYSWFVSVQEICSGNWSNQSFSFTTQDAPANDPDPGPGPDPDADPDDDDDDTSVNNPPDRPILNALKQFLKQKIKYFFNVSSDDSDGDMVRFQFDWGNGSFSSWTNFVSSSTYLLIEHVFDKIGSYKVRVRAQDENGNYSDWSEPYNITISSFPEEDTNPPQAKINVSGNFSVNGSVVFDASESSSLSGNITSYFWDFGDGKTSDKKMAYHVFAEPGVYNVTLVVTDNTGNSSWVYQDVTILDDSSEDSIGVNESDDNNGKNEDDDSGLFWFILLVVLVLVAVVCVILVLRRFNIF